MLRHCSLATLLLLSACGGGGGGGGETMPPPPPVPSLALLAGNVGGSGRADGVGAAARFHNPGGLAIDGAGNLYVADTGNGLVRKITPEGVVTTIASQLGLPVAVAVDVAGNEYVADTFNQRIYKITAGGALSTLAGNGQCSYVDGPAASASFCFPGGIGVDAFGNVFVGETTMIRRISTDGVVSTLAGAYLQFGAADGPGYLARFNQASGITVDASGSVLVADTYNYTIRRVAPDGTTSTVAGTTGASGIVDGVAATAKFSYPQAVGVDALANIYVGDASMVRRITAGGDVSTLAGSAQRGSADGTGSAALFYVVLGLAADSRGNVYATDAENNTIRKITSAGVVTTIAGSAEGRGSANGSGSAAQFDAPDGVAVDSSGNLYLADGGNASTSGVIRKVSSAGITTTIAGDATASRGSIDGVGAAARFNQPLGLAVNAAGQLFVSDVSCPPPLSRPPVPPCSGTIRRIAADGTVTTIAGRAGTTGNTDGPAAAATFTRPYGLALDAAGNLFVADSFAHTIRRIDPAGQVTTFAGASGQRGDTDGQGAAARFNQPSYLAFDPAGNLLVTDGQARVRRISPGGVVTTLVAEVANPFAQAHGIAVDEAANLYLGDPVHDVISKVTPSGSTVTVVGVADQETFQPGPLPGRIAPPRALAVRGTNLYFTLGNGIAVVTNRP